jgi:protein-disulfide isomerase
MEQFRIEAIKLMKRSILLVAVALAFGIAPASATDQSRPVGRFDAEQSRDIEAIVRDFILNHPEVIVESMQRLQAKEQKAEEQKSREAAGAVKPVDGEDHILGNPNAPVKLVEFSDFECPFCKRFHATLKQLMDEYGMDGKVAWVYRHFPIDELHSKARKEAQAAECANELGGNKAFWAYADRIFEVTPSNDRLDLALLPQIAQEIGLDRAKFEVCLKGDARGGKYAAHIEAERQDASTSGGTGTPYTLVIGANGEIFPISGAQPYAAVKSIIDAALKGK